ncbi:MAG: hypothetical protein JWP97_6671 [Labilithrix sp.]|nr:hypothetical protein [Labilithrix sp.]
MRRPLLVLLRWKGDIVATYDAVPPPAGADGAPDGVSVEVYDVNGDRSSLGLRSKVDLRPMLGIAISAALHLGVAAIVFLFLLKRGGSGIDAEQNQQGALLQEYMTRLAQNENAGEDKKPMEKRPAQVTPPEAQPPEENREEATLTPPPDVQQPTTPQPPETAPPAKTKAKGAGGKDHVSTSPSVCNAAKVGPTTGPMCRRLVTFGALRKAETCYVDTVAQPGEQGELDFPCNGDGEATLSFGSKTFAGAVVNGKLDVCTGTEYPFNDGCTWSSAQHVSGSVTSGALEFKYGEAPKRGDHDCAQACGATAAIRVDGAAL